MSATITEKTVRDLALEIPAATRVFEKLNIDYCCGGNRSLEEACRTAGVPLDRVLEALEAPAAAPVNDRNWSDASLVELIDHITGSHHAYTREALARISQLAAKVASVHGANHPELR